MISLFLRWVARPMFILAMCSGALAFDGTLVVANRAGGSISGEHGIGLEKMEFMPLLFTPDDLALQKDLRDAVDPRALSNPGKIFPDCRSCVEVGGKHRVVPL